MAQIDHLILWMGGVVTPHIWELVRWSSKVNLSSETCFALMHLERRVALGEIEPDEFCQYAAREFPTPIDADSVEKSILEAVHLHPGILRVVDELSEAYRVQLLSDFPARWMIPTMNRLDLSSRFSADDIVVTAEFGLTDLSADLLQRLTRVGIIVPGRSLLIDADAKRAEAAIRSGVDAALFVDVPRLCRELEMRNIVLHAA